MIRNISVFSEKHHQKFTRGKQHSEIHCLLVPALLDNLLVTTNFLSRDILSSGIKPSLKKIYRKNQLPNSASSLINITLARKEKSEVRSALRERSHLIFFSYFWSTVRRNEIFYVIPWTLRQKGISKTQAPSAQEDNASQEKWRRCWGLRRDKLSWKADVGGGGHGKN